MTEKPPIRNVQPIQEDNRKPADEARVKFSDLSAQLEGAELEENQRNIVTNIVDVFKKMSEGILETSSVEDEVALVDYFIDLSKRQLISHLQTDSDINSEIAKFLVTRRTLIGAIPYLQPEGLGVTENEKIFELAQFAIGNGVEESRVLGLTLLNSRLNPQQRKQIFGGLFVAHREEALRCFESFGLSENEVKDLILEKRELALKGREDMRVLAIAIMAEKALEEISPEEEIILEQTYINFPEMRSKIDGKYGGSYPEFLARKMDSQNIEWVERYPEALRPLLFKNLAVVEWTTGCSNVRFCKSYCQFGPKGKVSHIMPYEELRQLGYKYGKYMDLYDGTVQATHYCASDALDWSQKIGFGDLHAFHALDVYESWKQYHKEGLKENSVEINTTRVPKGKEDIVLSHSNRIAHISGFSDNKDLQPLRQWRNHQPLIDEGTSYLTYRERDAFFNGQEMPVGRNLNLNAIDCKFGTMIRTEHNGETSIKNITLANFPTPNYKTGYDITIDPGFVSNFGQDTFFENVPEVLKKCIVKYFWTESANRNKRRKWNKFQELYEFNSKITTPESYLEAVKDHFDFIEVYDDAGKLWYCLIEVISGNVAMLSLEEFLVFMEQNFMYEDGEQQVYATLNREFCKNFKDIKKMLLDRLEELKERFGVHGDDIVEKLFDHLKNNPDKKNSLFLVEDEI